MSVCDPNSPDCCERCQEAELKDVQQQLLEPQPPERVRELEDIETRLKALRLEARGLKRSGNPAVRATGKRAEAKCNDDLAWVRSQLSKEE